MFTRPRSKKKWASVADRFKSFAPFRLIGDSKNYVLLLSGRYCSNTAWVDFSSCSFNFRTLTYQLVILKTESSWTWRFGNVQWIELSLEVGTEQRADFMSCHLRRVSNLESLVLWAQIKCRFWDAAGCKFVNELEWVYLVFQVDCSLMLQFTRPLTLMNRCWKSTL